MEKKYYICVSKSEWETDPFHANYLDFKAVNRNEAKRYFSVSNSIDYVDVKCILRKNKHLLSANTF